MSGFTPPPACGVQEAALGPEPIEHEVLGFTA